MSFEQSGPPDRRIDWLDYARFICALAVVFFHYLSRGRRDYIPLVPDYGWVEEIARYGYLGVDFFFIVSGFVIMMSVGERKPSEFAAARILRLYPAYLFALVLTGIILALLQDPRFPVTLTQWLVNLTMVSTLVGVRAVDGVYWTLALEVVFYAAVCLLLLAGLRNRLEQCAVVWLGLQLIVRIFDYHIPLFDQYYMLFCAGCLLYFGCTRGWTVPRIAATALSLGMNIEDAIRRARQTVEATGEEALDPLVLAVIITSFFLAFIVLSRARLSLPYAKTIGSVTYPLYLIHQYLGYLLIGFLAHYVRPGIAIVLTVMAMIASALFIAQVVEQQPRAFWRRCSELAVIPLRWFEQAAVRIGPQWLFGHLKKA